LNFHCSGAGRFLDWTAGRAFGTIAVTNGVANPEIYMATVRDSPALG
jgi:hypothetical protein